MGKVKKGEPIYGRLSRVQMYSPALGVSPQRTVFGDEGQVLGVALLPQEGLTLSEVVAASSADRFTSEVWSVPSRGCGNPECPHNDGVVVIAVKTDDLPARIDRIVPLDYAAITIGVVDEHEERTAWLRCDIETVANLMVALANAVAVATEERERRRARWAEVTGRGKRPPTAGPHGRHDR